MRVYEFLETLDETADQLDILSGTAHDALFGREAIGFPCTASENKHYPGQRELWSSIMAIFDDYAAHALGSHIGFIYMRCDTIAQYAEFRMKFPTLDSAMLAEIFAPGVSMETKRRLSATGLTNREVLNLIAAVREEGKFIFEYGGYTAFLEKFVEDNVPEFADYC
jgi:hypothetical protein